MNLKKINEQLKPKVPDPYNPTRRYGVMGLALGGDLHDRLKIYAVKNNVNIDNILSPNESFDILNSILIVSKQVNIEETIIT